MTILVDTVLYNPSVEVLEVNKEQGTAVIKDLFNGGVEKTVKLHQSKVNSYEYYFILNRRSFWLHCLFKKKEESSKRIFNFEYLTPEENEAVTSHYHRCKKLFDTRAITLSEAQFIFTEKMIADYSEKAFGICTNVPMFNEEVEK